MSGLTRFKNRTQAGELLAERLAAYRHHGDVIVLALPRGGVPVGFSVARALDVPLDILLVRKLGVPGHEEYAMGAIAGGGLCVLQPEVLHMLGISEQVVEAVAQREMKEIARREKLYRANRPKLDVRDHVVILVDDGLATGSTMFAAINAVRQEKPARVVVAVPVGAPDTCKAVRSEVDEMICLLAPASFHAVGQWYEDFEQTSDDLVTALLDEAQRTRMQPKAALPANQTSKKKNRNAAAR
jgi:putative phosphoribosyl transferase